MVVESRSSVPWKIISACLFFVFWPHAVECGRILVPWPGIEPALPALEWGILTTVPSGRSLYSTFFMRPFYTLALRYHIVLWNLYAGQEAIVRTRYGTTAWFKIGKGVCQSCILSPWLFNLYEEYIMRNARLDEAQAGIKMAGRNINNHRFADDTTLWQKVKRN